MRIHAEIHINDKKMKERVFAAQKIADPKDGGTVMASLFENGTPLIRSEDAPQPPSQPAESE